MEIKYVLSMPEPDTHLFEIKILINNNESESQDFVLPAWIPGSYKIRDYPKNLQEFKALRTNKQQLRWEKTGKGSWRVYTPRVKNFEVHYNIYAFDLSIRTSHLDSTHGYYNGVSVFCYVEGYKDCPVTLKIIPYKNWRISTGLPELSGKKNEFRAENYDQLADSPGEIGTHSILEYRQNNINYTVAIYNDKAFDGDNLIRDLKKITGTIAKMFGTPLPYSSYVFLFQCVGEPGYNGLEHQNSTTIQYPFFCFSTPRMYQILLMLVSHEFFHAWNVKSIHSDVLGPFDYTKEVYTSTLWISEGLTSYFDKLILLRSGLSDVNKHLDGLCTRIEHLQSEPGRHIHSVAEASFNAWLKHYQPDENTVNSTVSYYEKGSLVGLALDLEIRHQTKNKSSLDSVMRYLYKNYGIKKQGFPDNKIKEIMEEAAGCDLSEIYNKYVFGKQDIDFNKYLAKAGLKFLKVSQNQKQKDDTSKPDKISRIPYLGIIFEKKDKNGLGITSVLHGSPAYKQGLYAKDEIIAVDGFRAVFENFKERIKSRKIGDAVKFTVFRNEKLLEIPVTLGQTEDAIYRISKNKKVSGLEKDIFKAWLGQDFDGWDDTYTPEPRRFTNTRI